ncbi:MAG: thiosulfate oxidation carrier protein SoxY [Proteobacteria bacterium]|jgi:sulfur-oxidizing protein SoxY|nr:thiosulfate oxidation carrier protein SoxY [Pseudomonadota bacterium]HCP34274.1 thiosulfate oxidation carrier protein SoxY [Deltaproteobacteria bacterium]|tara:strand:- start:179 stop:697 length:519 start_codon:yes stop_codon:yes gene_type:complete
MLRNPTSSLGVMLEKKMNNRREFFNTLSGSSLVLLAFGAGVTLPLSGWANWNQEAFHSKKFQKAVQSLYGSKLVEATDQIKIQAPDVAENGSSVPISVSTSIKEIEQLSIFIENNPLPLVATYHLKQHVIPNISVRVKIAKSSPIHVVVKSQGRLLFSSKKIHVTLSGCAED